MAGSSRKKSSRSSRSRSSSADLDQVVTDVRLRTQERPLRADRIASSRQVSKSGAGEDIRKLIRTVERFLDRLVGRVEGAYRVLLCATENGFHLVQRILQHARTRKPVRGQEVHRGRDSVLSRLQLSAQVRRDRGQGELRGFRAERGLECLSSRHELAKVVLGGWAEGSLAEEVVVVEGFLRLGPVAEPKVCPLLVASTASARSSDRTRSRTTSKSQPNGSFANSSERNRPVAVSP